MTPQLLIYLSQDGLLKAELPGANGSRRTVTVTSLDTIHRILSEQLYNPASLIGEDATPTTHQVRHWEEHYKRRLKAKLQSNCPFCKHEALTEQYHAAAHQDEPDLACPYCQAEMGVIRLPSVSRHINQASPASRSKKGKGKQPKYEPVSAGTSPSDVGI